MCSIQGLEAVSVASRALDLAWNASANQPSGDPKTKPTSWQSATKKAESQRPRFDYLVITWGLVRPMICWRRHPVRSLVAVAVAPCED